MSGFSGADAAQLRQLASRMGSQAGKLREIALSSTLALKTAEWTGNDIDRIRSNWSGQSLPRLRALADAFDRLAVELDRNAADQERASADGIAAQSSWFYGLGKWIEGWIATLPGLVIPFLPSFIGEGKDGEADQASDASASKMPEASGQDPVSPAPSNPAVPANSSNGPLQPPPSKNDFDHREPVQGFGDINPGQDNDGQCTSWAAWRRQQLGKAWATGNGGEMAGKLNGSANNPPTAGAIVSYGGVPGHVMIVEEVYPDGSFRVSEMNVVPIGSKDYLPVPGTLRTDRVWHPTGNGTYTFDGNAEYKKSTETLTIAP